MKRRMLSALLACCMALALLPAWSTAQAAGSLSAEKSYVLSEGEKFEFEFTPSETGIYRGSAEGLGAEDHGRIELSSADGEIVGGRGYGAEFFYAFLEAGETYTWCHWSFKGGDNYYVLDICYYPTLALSIDRKASYRRSGDDWREFVEFTPSESGWYTFKDSGRAVLYGVYAEGGVPFYDYPGTFTERGQHIYLEEDKPVILELCLYSETGSISVEKASFKSLKENSTASVTLEDADDGMGIDGGAFCDDYVSFTPSKSGTYKISFAPESDKVFSWGGSFSVKNSKGKGLPYENWDWEEKSGEYKLTAGDTYYIGASATPGGVCEISAKLIKAEEVRCEKHKYTSAGGNICTVCGYEFVPELVPCDKTLYTVKANVAIRNLPYAKAGTIVADGYAKGAAVRVTHTLINSVGRLWYMTEDGLYIYSENLTETEPVKYTLTFDANGGTGDPGALRVIEGVKVKLPNTVPTRSGYLFHGWAMDKSATDSEYQPGSGVKMTKHLTLYAVWLEKPGYIKATPELKAKMDAIIGEKQVKNTAGDGLCTSSATATLLQRRQALEGQQVTFSLADIRKTLGASVSDLNRGKYRPYAFIYESVWEDGVEPANANGATYKTKRETADRIGKDRKAYIIDLLADHPEGVVLYSRYVSNGGGLHAIVISDYDPERDQFYAYDGVDTRDRGCGRIKLEETWLYRANGKNVDNIFARLNSVWYVDLEA